MLLQIWMILVYTEGERVFIDVFAAICAGPVSAVRQRDVC